MFEELYKLGSMIKRNTDSGRKGKISWWVPDELFNSEGRLIVDDLLGAKVPDDWWHYAHERLRSRLKA